MNQEQIKLLHFGERYYDRIWGGQRLRQELGKNTPEGARIGEAWLLSDHPGDESVVDEGPLEGKSFRELLEAHPQAILGRRGQLTVHGRFPLLLKLLDSADWLSVQVHPDDATAKRLGEPDVGKTEMWHVLFAEPGSELICGLATDATPAVFREAAEAGNIESLMTRFAAAPGVSTFVAAGTVHAIGGGILLAEIQQNSDITYRIHDWGRIEKNGKGRALHIEKSIEAIHFGSVHGGPSEPLSYEAGGARRSVLAACRYFAAELLHIDGQACRETHGDSFHILLAKTGGIEVCADGQARFLNAGEAALVAGQVESFSVHGSGELLNYYVPVLARDIVEPLRFAGHSEGDIIRLGGDPAYSDLVNAATS